jgi:hypothetical protein
MCPIQTYQPTLIVNDHMDAEVTGNSNKESTKSPHSTSKGNLTFLILHARVQIAKWDFYIKCWIGFQVIGLNMKSIFLVLLVGYSIQNLSFDFSDDVSTSSLFLFNMISRSPKSIAIGSLAGVNYQAVTTAPNVVLTNLEPSALTPSIVPSNGCYRHDVFSTTDLSKLALVKPGDLLILHSSLLPIILLTNSYILFDNFTYSTLSPKELRKLLFGLQGISVAYGFKNELGVLNMNWVNLVSFA